MTQNKWKISNMKAQSRVRLTKVYPFHQRGSLLLPVGHWAQGPLIENIEVDKPVQLMRESSPRGDSNVGVFITSAVKKITRRHIHTANSIYRIDSVARAVLAGQNEYNGSLQFYCIDVPLILNRHGNYVVGFAPKASSGFVPFSPLNALFVYDRTGRCISHPPSAKYKHSGVNSVLNFYN
jgi:hypothetical protein